MNTKVSNELSQLYVDKVRNHQSNSVVEEKFKPKPFEKAGTKTKAEFIKNSGPDAAEGKKKDNVDSADEKSDKSHFEPKKFSQPTKKSKKGKINNSNKKKIMESKTTSKKSSFDLLYENVMSGDENINDLNELDVDAGADGAIEDIDTETDVVEDPKEVLQAAIEHLQKALDVLSAEAGTGEEGDEAFGEELPPVEGEGEDDLEGDGLNKESIEAEDLGTPLVNQKKGKPDATSGKANVVNSHNSKVSKGSASTDVTAGDGKLQKAPDGVPSLTKTKGSGNVPTSNVKAGRNVIGD